MTIIKVIITLIITIIIIKSISSTACLDNSAIYFLSLPASVVSMLNDTGSLVLVLSPNSQSALTAVGSLSPDVHHT